MKPSGRVTLYIKDLSEDEMDFYFNNVKRASTLIKNAMHNYYETERGNADSIRQSEEKKERKPALKKEKESKPIPTEQKQSTPIWKQPSRSENQVPNKEQPLPEVNQEAIRQLKSSVPEKDEANSTPSVTEDEQEKIKAMLLKNFRIF